MGFPCPVLFFISVIHFHADGTHVFIYLNLNIWNMGFQTELHLCVLDIKSIKVLLSLRLQLRVIKYE